MEKSTQHKKYPTQKVPHTRWSGVMLSRVYEPARYYVWKICKQFAVAAC